ARKRHFALAAGKLHALSPLAVLQRGYAIARLPDGTVVTDAAQTQPGDALEVKLLHGRLDCRVQSIERQGADD
ncbi:MAG TPA: exodeoxyribonuclease VII large subunit, partial [Polyangia bacterium]|nr:exodeoxyribonuclease VII large subunit [Polyangia bacterium]